MQNLSIIILYFMQELSILHQHRKELVSKSSIKAIYCFYFAAFANQTP